MNAPPSDSRSRPAALALALLALLLFAACTSRPRAQRHAAAPPPAAAAPAPSPRGNLVDAALLLTMYAHEHKGIYPDDVAVLADLNPFYDELLRNPDTGKPFVYLGKGLTIRDADKPLLLDPDPAGSQASAVTVKGTVIRLKLSDLPSSR